MAVAMFRGVGRALFGRIQRLHDVGGFNHPIYNYIHIYHWVHHGRYGRKKQTTTQLSDPQSPQSHKNAAKSQEGYHQQRGNV